MVKWRWRPTTENEFLAFLFTLVVVTLAILIELGRGFSPVVGFSSDFPYILTPLIVISASLIVTLVTRQLAEPKQDEFPLSVIFATAGVMILFGAVQASSGFDLIIKLVLYWVSMLLVAFAFYLVTPT